MKNPHISDPLNDALVLISVLIALQNVGLATISIVKQAVGLTVH